MERTMRQVSVIVAIALILTAFGCVSSPPPGDQNQQAPKQGKPLVKSLPAGIEGIEMVGDAVRVKEGFDWIKQPDGSMTVTRMGTGFGEAGTWNCECTTGPYSCQGSVEDGALRCRSTDCLSCKLIVKKDGLNTAVFIY
jgi:hypothetical protein